MHPRCAFMFMAPCEYLYEDSVLTFILCIQADIISNRSYSSILSELEENNNLDTAKILHNDKTYPSFSSLEQLLSHPDEDPMGIRNQFEKFLTADNLDYPIMLVRDDALESHDAVQKLNALVTKLGFEDDITEAIAKEGINKSNMTVESIGDDDVRERFIWRFAALDEIFASQPLIRLLLPKDKDKHH
jgi:hypothetical protein